MREPGAGVDQGLPGGSWAVGELAIAASAVLRHADGEPASALPLIAAFHRQRPLSAAEIEWYVASGEGMGKAGGYAIQGRAETFVRFLSGSHSNVIGLPLFETRALLAAAGLRLG